jgi:hypothetical protein
MNVGGPCGEGCSPPVKRMGVGGPIVVRGRESRPHGEGGQGSDAWWTISRRSFGEVRMEPSDLGGSDERRTNDRFGGKSPLLGEPGAVRHEAYRCNGQRSHSPFQVGDVPLGRSGQERFPDGERAAPKRSGEVRDRPPRRQAWQSDSTVSSNELGFDLRESSPLPHNILSRVD